MLQETGVESDVNISVVESPPEGDSVLVWMGNAVEIRKWQDLVICAGIPDITYLTGACFVRGSDLLVIATPTGVQLWHAATGERRLLYEPPGKTSISRIAISANGDTLAVASRRAPRKYSVDLFRLVLSDQVIRGG
jgi:hypothetical protein